MPYTFKDLTIYFNGSEMTLRRRVGELKTKKKFKKTSPGKSFSEKEALLIAKLLEFTFIPAYQNGNGKK
jgi:hypothetical protein